MNNPSIIWAEKLPVPESLSYTFFILFTSPIISFPGTEEKKEDLNGDEE